MKIIWYFIIPLLITSLIIFLIYTLVKKLINLIKTGK